MNLKILGIVPDPRHGRKSFWFSHFPCCFESQIRWPKYLWLLFHRKKYSNFDISVKAAANISKCIHTSVETLVWIHSSKLKIWLPKPYSTIEFFQLWCCTNLISVTKLSKSETREVVRGRGANNPAPPHHESGTSSK